MSEFHSDPLGEGCVRDWRVLISSKSVHDPSPHLPPSASEMKTPDMSNNGESPEGPMRDQLSADAATGTPGRLKLGTEVAFPPAEVAINAAAAASPDAQVLTEPEG